MIEVLFDNRAVTRYLEEILSHAGLPWRRTTSPDVTSRPPTPSVFLLAGRGTADSALRSWLTDAVRHGAALIAVGGTWGLDDLLGVRETGRCQEGYLRVNADHEVVRNLTSSLHVFDAAAFDATTGTSLGTLLDRNRQDALGDAIVIRRVGRGVAVIIAPDIPAAVRTIQHGPAIHSDGTPPPDDTAPIDDGVLKCDDGIALSWEHDRERTALATDEPDCPGKHPDFPAGDTPWFAQPVADELRALLLQSICWAVAEVGLPLPFVWYWPRGLPAVGLISHDSDLNIDETARTTLRLLAEIEVNSTWCMMEGPTYPDHFSSETFALVQQAGHETALHYNALDRDGGHWGKEPLFAQADWLRKIAGVERIASNKNHFTRWEGAVELFHWLEEAGIGSDQSRGPSKKGNVGYPFGSCLPWFPLDLAQSRFLNVLETPLQTQDLWLTTPFAIAPPILGQAVKHHGIAHFLFHQVHLHRRTEVAESTRRVVADGRTRGLEWWTGAEISDWERQRRAVALSCRRIADHHYQLEVETPESIPGFTAAVILPAGVADRLNTTATSPNGTVKTRTCTCHNQPVLTLEWDLSQGATTVDLTLT